jgi:hypothetical protein
MAVAKQECAAYPQRPQEYAIGQYEERGHSGDAVRLSGRSVIVISSTGS